MAHTHEYVQPSADRVVHRSMILFGRWAAVAGCSIVLISILMELYFVGYIVAALLCGMAESRGRCGMSHIGMIAPIKPIDSLMWVKSCLAYTGCGLATAYLVGLLIAGIGSWFSLGTSLIYLGLTCFVCLLFLVRDLDLVRFNPPQCDRQTYKEWVVMFGWLTGVGMWGAHIGLALSTVVTYSGLYCLLLVVFGAGFGNGEWIFVSFWLGRVIFLWATPFLMDSTSNGVAIGRAIESSTSAFRMNSICGMVSLLLLSLATLYTQFV